MSRVSEQHRKTGRFEIMFRDLPHEHQNAVRELGHIVITVARQDGPLGDHLLDAARYTGVVLVARKSSGGEYDFLIRGDGLAWWLGNEDGHGPVIEAPIALADASFDNAIRALLPATILEGNLISTGITAYTGTHNRQTRRAAIDYVCDTKGADWRIRPNGRLDAGQQDLVFGDPRAVIVRRIQDAGSDLDLDAYPGPAQTDVDIERYTTKVLVLGRVEDVDVVSGTAELPAADIPYKDLFGQQVTLTRIISESNTEGVNATARAQAALDEYSKPQRSVTLTSGEYDLRDVIECGADVWVWDPDAGMIDDANEIVWRGQRINPVREQVTMIDWPVTDKMGVYYRSADGEWLDLSQWVDPIDGQTNIEIGKDVDSFASSGGTSVVGRPGTSEPDTSIPGVPQFVQPFVQDIDASSGEPRVQMSVAWEGPNLNTDGTPFVDGANYEIRYRPSGYTSGTWAAAGLYRWRDLNTWAEPVPVPGSQDWETRYAPPDASTALVLGLAPATGYEFQIRAVDAASPPNPGAWSAPAFVRTINDTEPPATPAVPEAAGSKLQVSVFHNLGSDQGGTFNLGLDLAHLLVHFSQDPVAGVNFQPVNAPADQGGTLVGRIVATKANLIGRIPVVGTFPVDTTVPVFVRVVAVDLAGNASPPSAGVQVTAELIDFAWIASVRAETIVSGEVLASLVIGGEIATGPAGTQRVVINAGGIEATNASSQKYFDLDTATTSLTMVGTYRSAFSGERTELTTDGSFRMFGATGTDSASITNDGGIVRFRSRTGLHGRRSYIDFNPDGLIGYYASSTTTFSRFDFGQTFGVIGAPVLGMRVYSHLAPSDGTGNRFFMAVSTNGQPSGDLSDSVLHYYRRGRLSNGALILAPSNGCGILWAPEGIGITTGQDNENGPIYASAFNVSSSGLVKTEPQSPTFAGDDIERGGMTASDVLVKVPSYEWKYLFEGRRPAKPDGGGEWVNPEPPPQRTHWGPIAEDLQRVDPRLAHMGMHGLLSTDLRDLVGVNWAASREVILDVRALREQVRQLQTAVFGGPAPVVEGEVLDAR